MKRGAKLQKFGHTDTTLIIGLTIKFIDKDKTLSKLVCLNKDMNEILRDEVLRQSLIRSDKEEVELKRKDLWV